MTHNMPWLERHLGRTSECGRRMEPWRLGALATVAAVTCVVIARLRLRPRRSSARVAFVGNSILWYVLAPAEGLPPQSPLPTPFLPESRESIGLRSRCEHIRCGQKKENTQPREGWENGTPPPHRDFKERSVVLAVAHPWASTTSYLSPQFLTNSRSDLHATSRSSHSRRSLSCCLFP